MSGLRLLLLMSCWLLLLLLLSFVGWSACGCSVEPACGWLSRLWLAEPPVAAMAPVWPVAPAPVAAGACVLYGLPNFKKCGPNILYGRPSLKRNSKQQPAS